MKDRYCRILYRSTVKWLKSAYARTINFQELLWNKTEFSEIPLNIHFLITTGGLVP